MGRLYQEALTILWVRLKVDAEGSKRMLKLCPVPFLGCFECRNPCVTGGMRDGVYKVCSLWMKGAIEMEVF